MLNQLRHPVQCVEHDGLLYVACFGIEEEPGRSGIAILDVSARALLRERPLGVHVHHTYLMPTSRRVLFTDVGDPWVTPAILGGVYGIDARLEEEAVLISPPMHARAVVFPDGVQQQQQQQPQHAEARNNGILADSRAAAGRASADVAYIITQEPRGVATQVFALRADWGGARPNATVAASVALPLPLWPSDGGADVFVAGTSGRLFATDRYGDKGRLFELAFGSSASDGAGGLLRVAGSVELGLHPRYTDPLLSHSHIYSVSRDDGLLMKIAIEDGLRVEATQPAFVPQPCFLIEVSG